MSTRLYLFNLQYLKIGRLGIFLKYFQSWVNSFVNFECLRTVRIVHIARILGILRIALPFMRIGGRRVLDSQSMIANFARTCLKYYPHVCIYPSRSLAGMVPVLWGYILHNHV